MECCVPLCGNSSENVLSGKITFHRFPSESRLRAVWLRAIGGQGSHLPADSAVVCSQHFLHDDIRETESGSKQLRPGAVPSTVLICMICLDTDSKMSPISQYNLEEAYEKLTGHPLCDGGNLKHILCVICAQRLKNFRRFREQSLRARSIMMELLEQHESTTKEHIKMIKHTTYPLRDNLVSTTLGPDCCDMYIVENINENRHTVSEETVLQAAVKTVDDTQYVDEGKRELNKENSYAYCIRDLIKYEGAAFMCTVCCEEFSHEHAYSAHMRMHLHGDAHPAASSAHSAVAQLYARLATTIGNEARATEAADTTKHIERAIVTNSSASDNQAPNCDDRTNTDLKSCVVKFHDISKYPESAKIKVESSPQTLPSITFRGSLNIRAACKDAQYHVASEDEVATIKKKPAPSMLSDTEPGTTGSSSRTRTSTFTCDVCERAFIRIGHLVKHMKVYSGEKPYSCEACSYKCKDKSALVYHMRTHTGEKPYSCKICPYKSKTKGHLDMHMKTHTGEKPYSCKLCSYKCTQKDRLVCHMRTHTGEKPYACKICPYKSKAKGALVYHMRNHTGEKPYACKICPYKSKAKGALVYHMRTHTGEKPYACKICTYKSIAKGALVYHMRTHTDEKPYACKICTYKSNLKGNLVQHMRTHTGEKPYACKICPYKSKAKGQLDRHMKTHTGEKPYSCETCSYKSTQKGNLIQHMRTHIHEKRYSCGTCSYKCTKKGDLVKHKRTHRGEKPYNL